MNEQEQGQKRFALAGQNDEEAVRFDQAIFIGRTPQAEFENSLVDVDFVLEYSGVSRIHARICPDETGVWVEDLGSRNGTFVNDQRVDKRTKAVNRDRIRFELQEFKLIDHDAVDEPARRESVDTFASVFRAVEEAVPEAGDDEGKKGGTIMLPINRNLPPGWIDDRQAGTLFMRPEDLDQSSIAPDLDRLEEQADGPTLLILSGDEAGRPFKLESSSEINFWNIGKESAEHDLSIVINDPSVSDFHAKLVRRGDRWKIIDQMSTNHIYINGNQFTVAYLASKDHIRFGRVESLLLLPQSKRMDQGKSEKSGLFRRLLNALGIGK